MSFAAGARYHIALPALAIHLAADYGGHNFTIKSPSAQRPEIPNVRFRYVRAGVGASVDLTSRIGVHVEGGYRYILSAGEIETAMYFPKLDAAAVDSRLALRIGIASGIQVELAGTLERFFFSMNPNPGDPMVAGGATDQYLGGQLSLRYSPPL